MKQPMKPKPLAMDAEDKREPKMSPAAFRKEERAEAQMQAEMKRDPEDRAEAKMSPTAFMKEEAAEMKGHKGLPADHPISKMHRGGK